MLCNAVGSERCSNTHILDCLKEIFVLIDLSYQRDYISPGLLHLTVYAAARSYGYAVLSFRLDWNSYDDPRLLNSFSGRPMRK